MSYRVITHRDGTIGAPGNRRMYILDEATNAVIAEVVQEDGVKPLVELANRAVKEAVEKSQERTRATGGG